MTTTLLASFPSPAQGVWHLGPVPIRAYALFIIIGIVAALVIGDRRWEARGSERDVIYDIALWAVPFGLIGGRLYHVMTDWQTYFGANGSGPIAALRIWEGGLGIWGAVALGGVGAWIGCKRRGIPLPAFGDAIAPGIVLAQAVGRLGNYFNQELYGRVTEVPWGMEIFYRQDPSGIVDVHSLNGVSTGEVAAVVHPTFLYELVWNLLVFAALIYVDRRFNIGHGRLFALYVAGYCVGRFGVELMRDDFATQIAGIRINSFTSTFVFIGAIVYVILAPKGREAPETLRGNTLDEEPTKTPEPADELVAAAATTGVVAATMVAAREDEPEPGREPDTEPEPEAALEPTDADDVEESPVDEAIVEAEATAGGELFTETAAEAEDAQLIDEDHDPVEEEDLESLQDEVAVVGVDGPASEQQEELAEDLEAGDKIESDAQAEAEENAAEGLADVDETDTPEPETEAEEPEADVEAEVLTTGVVAEAAVEAEAADLIDEDHDPVDEEDLESLRDDVSVVGADGPASEQQEDVAEDLESESKVESDEQAEAEENTAEGLADVVEEGTTEPEPEVVAEEPAAEPEVLTDAPTSEQQEELDADTEAESGIDSDVQAAAEENAAEGVADVDDTDTDTAGDEAAPDETDVLASVGLVDDADEPEPTPDEAAEETPAPAPKRAWPTTATPKEPTSRLGKLLRRRKS
ncbi:prolipoprotein diacylglyceryl transferase [soil metagenome]